MVNLTLLVLSRLDVNRLSAIVQNLGLEYEKKVLHSIRNEVLKAVVAQFNTDPLLTERPHFSALVAQQEAERSKFVVMKAEQERRAAIIRDKGESESAKLISYVISSAGIGLIELRKIEASREVAATLAKTPNVSYLPGGKNLLLGLNPQR
ncbi:Prohibitin mitochondrial-like [Quillaja saponaria]|uniref:Prohibitin n=1 Tax=Quillaja saponaria TaxID=32244 RepID=A0AAD7VKF2_QUISA|nr:Prohibitin mitochondrial-like [Quillaja saponaria]